MLPSIVQAFLFHLISVIGFEAIVSSFLQEALDIVQICKEEQEQAFAMLAAVLWLGNISFQVIDNENHVEASADEGNNMVLALHNDPSSVNILHFLLYLGFFSLCFIFLSRERETGFLLCYSIFQGTEFA